ncbi:ScbR family autoregulator-binding transcription factor [Streptomyces fuscigenes]|uniref:ScbR family autoregulator-binding transcription factor n=1 Tax=Streptomyces fuscigenes TaxID=1528880 RepID=UPI001F3A63FD|nr:ScbR family autoregulator-binding transcription factor [Streptomyces fuscigenes]MCF3960173.1 TetR/AcrR family transcriptional regulator [Streptomyces fuscigenes]
MTPPQQERAAKTRAAIVRAAAEEFDLHGYAGTSTTKIVKRAGSTMGALYFHFASKDDLAKAVMSEQAEDLPGLERSEGLQHLIDLTFALGRELQRNVLLRAGVRLAIEQGSFGVQDDTAYQLWINVFKEELLAAQALGQLSEGVDPAGFARVLVGAYSGTQLLSQISTGRKDIQERIAELWSYFLPAIAPPEVVAHLGLPSATAGAAE